MTAVRVGLLTLVLLAGATVRSVPPPDNTVQGNTQTFTAGPGDCYLINGVWVCEP